MKLFLSVLCLFVGLLFWTPQIDAREDYGFTSMPVGELQIYPLHDADTTMEARLLPDLDKYPQYKDLFKRGPLPAVSRTFFFRLGKRNILVDAGWGSELGIKGDTLKILRANGVSPDSISDILLTHLDLDHIGGLLEQGKPVFPKANLWISEKEAKAWRDGDVKKRPESAIQLARDVLRAYSGRIKLFNYGEEILPGVFAVDASGHTPGHTAFSIVSGKDKLIIGGDIMHIWQAQLPQPELSSTYDMDMKKAADTRIGLLQSAVKDKALLGGMHFPMISDVQIRPDGGFMMREPR